MAEVSVRFGIKVMLRFRDSVSLSSVSVLGKVKVWGYGKSYG